MTPVPAAKTPLVALAWMALLALIVGTTVLGGLLGRLEMHAEDAVIARATSALHATAHEVTVFTWLPPPRG
jgi:hypothetical protein